MHVGGVTRRAPSANTKDGEVVEGNQSAMVRRGVEDNVGDEPLERSAHGQTEGRSRVRAMLHGPTGSDGARW